MQKKDQTTKVRVFISHAVANDTIAHRLVDLLVGGVGLQSHEIFCSSLSGHSISTGKGFVEKIRSALLDADVVMTVLTANYNESIFCVAELGGAWTLNKDPYPMVVPPLKKSDIGAVLLGRQAMKIDAEEDLDVMLDDLKRDLGIAGNPTPIWTRKKKEFIEHISTLVPKQPAPKKVDFDAHEKLKNELKEYKDSFAKIEAELDKQKEIEKKLLKSDSASERRKIVFDNLPDKQKFDKLIKQYEEAYEDLPVVVAEVLYYAFLRKRYWPENVDDRLDQAQEDGYISIDEDEQSIEPNFDDPKVKRLNKAVMRIKTFLESESESEFSDQFIEENDYSPNLDNKRFWKDFLRI